MRHICVLLLAGFSTIAFAQKDIPRVQVFGGFSYLHIDTQGVTGTSLDARCNRISSGACPTGTFHIHPNANGWNASADVAVHRWFGIKADFSGHYLTPLTLSPAAQSVVTKAGVSGFPPNATNYAFLFGPVAHRDFHRYTVFGHALVGLDRFSFGTITTPPFTVSSVSVPSMHVNIANTGLGVAFGGGFDVKINDRFSIRTGQIDYLYTQHNFNFIVKTVNTHQNNIRASVGLVFHFGVRPTQPTQPATHRVSSGSTDTMPIPALGIYVRSDNAGARITEVVPNSVAASAGVHPDDIINSVNNAHIRTATELAGIVSSIAPGSTVRLGIRVRGMWQTETTVILGSQ